MKSQFPRGVSTVLILGIIAVLVTIVVPLISRTVVDVRITKQQEEQARAFSIAETGLEKAIIAEFGAGDSIGDTIDDIDYTVTRQGRGGSSVFSYPKAVEKDSPITIWLVAHEDEGDSFDPEAQLDPTDNPYQAGVIDLYWGEPGTEINDQTPAIEATLFYESGGTFLVGRYAYDPRGDRGNNFELAESGGFSDQGTEFHRQINPFPCTALSGNTCYALRLRLLYSDDSHPLLVEGADDLPPQGECYESVATVQTSKVTSRVQRCVFYKDFPSVFDFVLYSRSDNLEKTVP